MTHAVAAADDPLAGTAYRSLKSLSSGGMGEVLLAEHRQLGRKCVAKVLHGHLAGEPRLVDRMRVEAQSLGRLNHPHIVSILGVGNTADGRPFLVMEHLRGRTLAEEMRLHGGQLPVLEAVAYACQLMSALAAAHGIGVIHRDIKPDNLFLCERSDGVRLLKVLDFGVARILPEATGAPAPLQVPTDTGVVIGTLRYVSPEAARGEPVDQRADLYAAALVLYRMLAGQGPFDHIEDDAALLRAQIEAPPSPPSARSFAPVPAELDRLVLRALAKNPADRFQTADELRAALEEIGQSLLGPLGWADTLAFDLSTQERPSEEAAGVLESASRWVVGPGEPSVRVAQDAPTAADSGSPPAAGLSKRVLLLLFALTVLGVVVVVASVVVALGWLR